MKMTNANVFDELWQVICQRAESTSTEKSYVRHLLFHEKGLNKPLEKVGEEACEFVLACKDGKQEQSRQSDCTELDIHGDDEVNTERKAGQADDRNDQGFPFRLQPEGQF